MDNKDRSVINGGILERALQDPLRKKYGLSIIFVTEEKFPGFIGWQKTAEEDQTENDIKVLYSKRGIKNTAYSYFTGIGGLIDIDFDWPWLYDEAVRHFGSRFNTRTLKTPNGGYRVLFRTDKPKDYLEYKAKPPFIEIHGKSTHQIVVRGQVLDERGELKEYRVINDSDIRHDPNIMEDFKIFLQQTMEACYFLEYPCIKSKLTGKENELTQDQRTSIGAFFVAEKIKIKLATDFFSCTDDFDPDKTSKHLQRLYDKGFKHPTCKKLRKNFHWDQKDCIGCPRHHQNLQKNPEDGIIPPIGKFLEESRVEVPKLRHGQGYDYDLGLTFIGVPPSGPITGYYGISLKKPIRAIKESHQINGKFANPLPVVGGFTDPLTDKTNWQIRQLLNEQHTEGKIGHRAFSALFEDLLSRSCDYLDLSEGDRLIIVLWIMGTYLRALFTWYPYLCFEGLRDVGKSTALEYLSHTCFNGGGDVSGGYTEADLHKSASSSMGFFAVDHLEERLKSPEKRQILSEFIENAWKLNSYVSKRDQNTGEHLKLYLASSVALGTRQTTESIAEKGVIIKMEETTNLEIRKRSVTMHKDPYFKDIEGDLMASALHYQNEVKMVYENIPVDSGLGREYNKFLPLMAMAKIVDQEKKRNQQYYEKVLNYAHQYRQNRKEEHEDTEEILLRLILQDKIVKTTYRDLADKMVTEGQDNYSWKRAQSDLSKLGVVKRRDKSQSPIKLTICLERAKKRAKQRGIKVEDNKISYDLVLSRSDKCPTDLRQLNRIEQAILQELATFKIHTKISVINGVKDTSPYKTKEIGDEIESMIVKEWIEQQERL
ncbi:hypothetical protein FGU46_01240 [Methanobacterium sp. CWC-01]|uniref:hypothetical protein n=1 Tax=Methanobacterium aridiramus TaxID=2584467 RepID=UPI002575CB73|nr:hypothetical protein [Methanobacterium sp. CWC-01]WJI08812.1 hypothetical protein FGU46_01240 [Methanobacterium sp. CWC-01]